MHHVRWLPAAMAFILLSCCLSITAANAAVQADSVNVATNDSTYTGAIENVTLIKKATTKAVQEEEWLVGKNFPNPFNVSDSTGVGQVLAIHRVEPGIRIPSDQLAFLLPAGNEHAQQANAIQSSNRTKTPETTFFRQGRTPHAHVVMLASIHRGVDQWCRNGVWRVPVIACP